MVGLTKACPNNIGKMLLMEESGCIASEAEEDIECVYGEENLSCI